MKKLIISMFALAAVLSSCSKSEVMDSRYENIPISFTTYNGRTPEVKATEVTSNNITSETISVYSEYTADNKLFAEFTLTNGDKGWGYGDTDIYWPGENELDFYAYCNHATGVLNVTDAKTLSVTIPNAISEQKDVLVAVSQRNRKAGDASQVSLQFEHLLSRIHFSLKTSATSTVPVTVEEIKITGDFYTTGNVAYKAVTKEENSTIKYDEYYPYIAIATDNTASPMTYNYLGENNIFKGDVTGPIFANFTAGASGAAIADATADNRYMMIIPTSSHNASLNIKYSINNGPTLTPAAIPLSTIAFEAGKSYEFILNVALNNISFDVNVTDWNETESTTGNVGYTIDLK